MNSGHIKRILFAGVLMALSFLTACVSKFSYRPLSSFKLTDSALKEGDTVKVIYCSGGPDDNKDKDFYYHLIVESGDRRKVNVLTTDISGLKQEESTKIFIPAASATYKVLENQDALPSSGNVNDLKVKEITRVVVNKEHRAAADNTYPTMIGALGDDPASLPEAIKAIMLKAIDSAHRH